jgi:hypothetical protein
VRRLVLRIRGGGGAPPVSLSSRNGSETIMGHVVNRIGDAGPNPPAERLDLPEPTKSMINLRSHPIAQKRLRVAKTNYHSGIGSASLADLGRG